VFFVSFVKETAGERRGGIAALSIEWREERQKRRLKRNEKKNVFDCGI